MTTIDHALTYIAQNWPVFPCHGDKTPRTTIGFKAASKAERIVRRWWDDWPDAMIGLPTGAPIGAWVLDIDPRHGGDATLAALTEAHGALPHTRSATTAGGGTHYYFAHVPGVRNRGSVGDGIDVRGDGGYVIAPGSVTDDGTLYEWLNDGPVLPAPDWLLALVVRREPPAKPATAPATNISDRYVDAAVRAELDDLAATPQGNRNNRLNDAAFALGTFVGAGALSEGEARGLLQDTARTWGRDWSRCAKTIENGLRAGIASPRALPEPARRDDALAEQGARIAAALLKGAPLEPTEPLPPIRATPFEWRDPATIPRRQWLYGRHYVRKYLSLTVAPGGVGKSSLAVAEALAMATQRQFLGHASADKLGVWYFNGEDDSEELARRVMAACIRFKIEPGEIRGRLFVDSGREQRLCVMEDVNKSLRISVPIVDAVKAAIAEHGIDVFIADPFVSTHAVPENDNGAIDRVAKLWAKIADEMNVAVELIHHVKKVDGREVTVDDARGAGALVAAARSVRVLNRMSATQAASAGVNADDRGQYFSVEIGKANMSPPSGKGEWRRLESVMLGNGAGITRPQDAVGVVTEWAWPGADAVVADVPPEALDLVKVRIANTNCRENEQCGDWAGYVVAEALGLDTDDKAEKARVRALLKAWIKAGDLAIEERRVKPGGGMKKHIVVAKSA